MSPPRVVHVYKDVYPPVEGGVERVIYHLARLTRDEFAPVVITAAKGMQGGRRTIAEDVEVIEVPSLGRALSTPMAPGFVAALKKAGADLFHFHVPHPTGELAFMTSGLKTPAVATYHGDVVRQRMAMAGYRPLMNRFLSRMAVIMPTSRRYLETSPILAPHAERCEIVPLGYPPEEYEADAEVSRRAEEFRTKWGEFIFFIGCLRYYKGLPYLIEAVRELPGRHVAIAGSGNEEPELRGLIERYGLGDRVHLLGRVDQPTALALFHGAGVFALPACERSEAFGLCQIESMFCGLPVISTDLPTGVPEVNRDGESGLIVPPKNASALAGALARYFSDAELQRSLREGARRRGLELYTADRMAEQVKGIYRRVLEQGNPKRSDR